MHCVTAIAPMEIFSSYRCAVRQQKCSAALVWTKCIPHYSVLLCKTGSQHALCDCNYTYGDFLFIQVCSDPAPMQCSTGFGKIKSPLFSAALKNKLTAGLCHCKYTYGSLLFTQVCSDSAPIQRSTGFGKMQSPLVSAALQNRLTAGLCHCNYTNGDFLFIQVCSEATETQCSTGLGKMYSPLFSVALHNRFTACIV